MSTAVLVNKRDFRIEETPIQVDEGSWPDFGWPYAGETHSVSGGAEPSKVASYPWFWKHDKENEDPYANGLAIPLERLVTGEVSIIRIPSFLAEDECLLLASYLKEHPARKNYPHEIKHPDGTVEFIDYGISRIGPARNRLFGRDPSDLETQAIIAEYFEEGQQMMDGIRNLLGFHPMEKLLKQLQNGWDAGAHIDNFAGQQAYSGIGRITESGAGLKISEEPHTDSLPPELGCQMQFGANIYLSVPNEGGELALWDGDKDGNPTVKLWKVKPSMGDLILVNTGKLHSVEPFFEGERVTLTSFVGYFGDTPQGERTPIRIWS